MEPFSEAECVSRLSEILSEQRALAHEQLTSRWREELDRILEERFTEIARQVGAQLEAVLEGARAARAIETQQTAAAPQPTSTAEEGLDLRAQRFARVRVAGMRLYQAEAVARGREQQSLYRELKTEIDAARAAFEQEFLSARPSLPDYLHLELVRTLAHDDAARLGPDYPGPLL
jgi:hypothetical protein